MNVENEWCDSIDANKVDGAGKRIEVKEVWFAMNCMKIRKGGGSSGVAIELFKPDGISVWNLWQTYLISYSRISDQRNGCWVH